METKNHVGATPISVVVVNYNGMAHLEECLTALECQHYADYEVLLVDNNSTDESVAFVTRHFPKVRVLASADNLGYAGGVNLALQHARGQYIAVLNQDAMAEPDCLLQMARFLDRHHKVGVVTPKILLYHRPDYINALGQNVHITALGFNRAYNRPDQPDATVPMRVSGLHGAAFLIRRELLEQMDGMNAACFLYHEDVDLSWIVQLMGYSIYCVPTAVVRHKYTLKMDAQKLFYLERNRVAMLLANLQWTTLLVLLPFLLLTEAMMAAYCLRKGPRFVHAKVRSLAWVWQRRQQIGIRRRQIQALRQRSDWALIAGLRIGYDWDQLITLGRPSTGRRMAQA